MRHLALAGALLLAACAKPETDEQATARMATESATARTTLEAINLRYERFVNENLPDSVAALFMENGVMMPPNAPAATGRAAITAALAAQPMPPGSSMKFTIADVAANGPIVVERGTYLFTMPAMGNTPAMNVAGKYLTHWHYVNGTLLQAASAWSDDAPAAPPGG